MLSKEITKRGRTLSPDSIFPDFLCTCQFSFNGSTSEKTNYFRHNRVLLHLQHRYPSEEIVSLEALQNSKQYLPQ